MGVNGSPMSGHPHIVTESKDVVGVRVFPERLAAVGSRLVDSGVWG